MEPTNPQDTHTSQEVAVEQTIASASPDPSFTEIAQKISKTLLSTLSIILLVHGLLGLYDEIINVFFIFPKLNLVYEAYDYSPEIFQSLVTNTILLTISALIQTIYSLGIMANRKELDPRIHIIGALGILVVARLITEGLPPLETGGLITRPPLSHEFIDFVLSKLG